MNIEHQRRLKVKPFRKKLNLSQAELAQKVGVDRTAVVKWETGQALPNADKLPTLANVLGCTIDDLYEK